MSSRRNASQASGLLTSCASCDLCRSNATGDEQKKLDVVSDDVFINACTFSEQIYIMVSEEHDKPIILEEKTGGYAIVFDPLDGSSNIEANVSGTT